MAPLVVLVTKMLLVLTLAGDITVAVFFAALLARRAAWSRQILDCFKKAALPAAFVIAAGSALGSLFYSEVAGFAPCLLCWWQRIFLYPQVVLFAFGLWRRDEKIWDYGLAFSVLGALIALYNAYLQFGGSFAGPCDAAGISCSKRYFLEFGYITIPTMALTSFLLLIVLGVAHKLRKPVQ